MTFIRDWLKGYKFGWFGQRASDCLGLDSFLDLQLILCCDFGLDTVSTNNDLTTIFSIEEHTYIRENWTSAFLDLALKQSEKKLSDYLLASPEPICLLAYSATPYLARFAEIHKDKLTLIMPNPELKVKLDNKIFFRQILNYLDQSQIDGITQDLSEIEYNEIVAKLGSPFVITLPYGSAGAGTFFIKQPEDLEQILATCEEKFVLINKYIDGISLNVNACVLGDQVFVSNPSVQLVGLNECTNRAEIYCGNDFSSIEYCPEQIIQKSKESVLRIGIWLKNIGYQGLFGVDLIADLNHNIVYPIDLNPRFQNSTYLLTQMEIRSGVIPLTVLNIATQIGVKRGEFPNPTMIDMIGSQIILHNISDETVMINQNFLPGVYTKNNESFSRIRDGFSLLDVKYDEEFIVTCAVPRKGTIVKPGAPLLKILTLQRVVDVNSNVLLPEISRFCKHVYNQLITKPVYNNKGSML